MRTNKENTACAEPLAKVETDVALIQAESYTFLQDKKAPGRNGNREFFFSVTK
ncbi:hypothetical protein SRRS_11390 [Sporomusa rhizae]|uniref:hypothetical protein n=1 Tax=Sporomusa rhizae TaxID=357999 RepID=UPI00352BAA2E